MCGYTFSEAWQYGQMLANNARINSKVKDYSYRYIFGFTVFSCFGLSSVFVSHSSISVLEENSIVDVENREDS